MKTKTILALGADIKNRFLIAKGKSIWLGPDIGDLSDTINYEFFKKEIRKAIKKNKPDIIAYDLHPGYFSTIFARTPNPQLPTPNLLPVQHHHAHVASVMQEYNLKRPVIGISFDGAGFGADGNMWGGEFFIVDKVGFKRLAHFKYMKMPGADKVVSEPWRMVLSILGKTGSYFINNVKEKDKRLVMSMMSKNINSPLTSSIGRIFDAAAAILGICTHASYEAEGPIKLEAMCEDNIVGSYEFGVLRHESIYIIDTRDLFLGMIKDLRKRKNKQIMATKFHNSITEIVIKTVKRLSKDTDIKDIALSGGVFQNKFLRKNIIKGLSDSKSNVFINKNAPVNDFNISLGQYYVSSCTCKN